MRVRAIGSRLQVDPVLISMDVNERHIIARGGRASPARNGADALRVSGMRVNPRQAYPG